jgi:hypothetical protein
MRSNFSSHSNSDRPSRLDAADLHMPGIADPAHAPHPSSGLCRACGGKIPAPDQWYTVDHPRASGWFPEPVCSPACLQVARSKSTPDVSSAGSAWLDENCPPSFLEPWDARAGDNAALNTALKFNTAGKRGLILRGKTRAGKTRTAWQIVQRAVLQGVPCAFVHAGELFDEGAPSYARTPLLAIDDLGHEMLSQKHGSRLLALIRSRVEWKRPFIVTTQYDGASLVGRFGDTATGHAVVERLREFCDVVTVTKPEQAPQLDLSRN